MFFIKNSSKSILISISSLLILTFIITLFNYINIINFNIVNILSYIIPFISFFIGAFYLGKKSLNRGWFEGLKLGIISIIILFIFNFLAFNEGYNLENIILYCIVLISNIFGSMIGISRKKDL